jgi:prepilin-type N-terminal cleavage/methylation domain-containing protein
MRRRQAFTLIELLVVMALVVFIMTILSGAFALGLKTFRDLKALGNMDERLRSVTTQLRADLTADHFEGRRKLSDPSFWFQGVPDPAGSGFTIPREGFVHIVQSSALPAAAGAFPPFMGGFWDPTKPRPAFFVEGVDGDGLPSYVAVDHLLHLSVKQRGNRRDKFFAALAPAGSPLFNVPTNFDTELSNSDARFQDPTQPLYNSQWAEVAYFLVANGDTAGNAPGGTPLYILYRSEFVVVPDNSNLNWATNPATPGLPIAYGQNANYQGFSWNDQVSNAQGTLVFNSPSDLSSTPTHRAFSALNLGRAATMLMTDVISFQIQVLRSDNPTDFTDVVPSSVLGVTPNPPAAYSLNPLGVPPGPPVGPYSFDTSTPPALVVGATQPYRILAIKITLRVWDAKTQLTRQITMIQDL